MATTLHPPISASALLHEESLSASRELTWLLSTTLTETLSSIRTGLHDCTHLLSPPSNPPTTLALSSPRSEALKGHVTRTGARITKGEMMLKLPGLPPTRGLQAHKLSVSPGGERPLMLEQLVDVGNFVAASLRLLGDDGEGGVGERCLRGGGEEAMAALGELLGNIRSARAALKGAAGRRLFPYHAVDPRVFEPPLHQNLAFDLYISEAAVTVELRVLEPVAVAEGPKVGFLESGGAAAGFGLRFAAAVGLGGGVKVEQGEEAVVFRGGSVRVKERVRVESQDPNLMAVWAKLGGLEHALALAIKSLAMVSGARE